MVGRRHETNILERLFTNDKSEFVTITGRRRVGKTFLIRQFFKDKLTFEATGIQHATTKEQLSNFYFALRQYFTFDSDKYTKPNSWIEAFEILIYNLEDVKSKTKKIIFIDEMPWMASNRKEYIKGLSFFWNSWASKNDVILIACGSAASWMTQEIILNKGGLHNRVTRQIELQPFNLNETKEYLEQQGVQLSNYQITQLYMVLGGIPYYLQLVPKGMSIPQIIDSLLLDKKSPLKNEFQNLYRSLFNNSEKYVKIIEACYTKWKGITHTELAKISNLPSGGSLTRMIKELEASGFLQIYRPIDNRKKNTLIRLTDEFSIFYLKYIKASSWTTINKSRSFNTWQGFAFENICFKHIKQIKAKLGIMGVNTRTYSYQEIGTTTNKGVQIDLIIDRDDNIVHICEAKFYNKAFLVSKKYREELEHKINKLRAVISTIKTIHITLLTSVGLKKNIHSDTIQSTIILDDLFNHLPNQS